MRAYLTYKSTGNVFGMRWKMASSWDEVDIVLPAGASEVETAAAGRAIKLADGQICPDLLTAHHDGICQPYIVDCSGSTPRNIYLKFNMVGHHSERADRAYRDSIFKTGEKAYEA